MQVSPLVRSSILASIIVLVGGFVTNPVMADPVVIQLGSFNGTVQPVTYTLAEGTFTTGPISLTLNTSTPSFFTIDQVTGVITAHTVMDVSFDNGRGVVLTGTLVIDEMGLLGPQPILMDITSGLLSGAGEFSGTRVFGRNPTFFDPDVFCPISWRFSPPDSPPFIFLDLPPGFINGDSVPIHGDCEACAVPEPASLVLLSTGLAGIVTTVLKRRRREGR